MFKMYKEEFRCLFEQNIYLSCVEETSCRDGATSYELTRRPHSFIIYLFSRKYYGTSKTMQLLLHFVSKV